MRLLFGLVSISAILCCGCATTSGLAPAPISLKDETPQYSFAYDAPVEVTQLPGLASALTKDAASKKAELLRENAEFRRDMPNDPRGMVQMYYEAAWTRAGDAGDLASVEMSMAAYGGGAHPISGFESYILDKKTSRRLKLADLFSKPLDQTGLPDALCRAIAAEKTDRGATPDNIGDPLKCSGKHANVKLDAPVVFVKSTLPGKAAGLRFLFGPYEVGSYAEGPYVVDVPAAVFAPDLKPIHAAGFGGAPSPDDPTNPDGM